LYVCVSITNPSFYCTDWRQHTRTLRQQQYGYYCVVDECVTSDDNNTLYEHPSEVYVEVEEQQADDDDDEQATTASMEDGETIPRRRKGTVYLDTLPPTRGGNKKKQHIRRRSPVNVENIENTLHRQQQQQQCDTVMKQITQPVPSGFCIPRVQQRDNDEKKNIQQHIDAFVYMHPHYSHYQHNGNDDMIKRMLNEYYQQQQYFYNHYNVNQQQKQDDDDDLYDEDSKQHHYRTPSPVQRQRTFGGRRSRHAHFYHRFNHMNCMKIETPDEYDILRESEVQRVGDRINGVERVRCLFVFFCILGHFLVANTGGSVYYAATSTFTVAECVTTAAV
jgi:hypothetical protein